MGALRKLVRCAVPELAAAQGMEPGRIDDMLFDSEITRRAGTGTSSWSSRCARRRDSGPHGPWSASSPGAILATGQAGQMASAHGDDPYITWPPHPDPEVEQLFRQADRDGYVIYCHGGVYTLVSPGATEDFHVLGRVVASSGIWRLQVNDLREWLAQTANDGAEGQG